MFDFSKNKMIYRWKRIKKLSSGKGNLFFMEGVKRIMEFKDGGTIRLQESKNIMYIVYFRN